MPSDKEKKAIAKFFEKQSQSAQILPNALFGHSLYIGIIGPFASGKTEFIKAISDFPVTAVGRYVPCSQYGRDGIVYFDFGGITIDEYLYVFLFGLPGSKIFDPCLLEKNGMSEELLGIIVVVDSSKSETFRECRNILRQLRAHKKNRLFMVVANKQDDIDAWETNDLRIALRLHNDEKIVPCSAHDKNSVKQAVLELLYQVRDLLET